MNHFNNFQESFPSFNDRLNALTNRFMPSSGDICAFQPRSS
jgi:hypothetical protein